MNQREREGAVQQAAPEDLPGGVEGGQHGADHGQAAPEEADQADDGRRLLAVLGGADGVLDHLGGFALEPELADHVAGEVRVAGGQEPDHRDAHQQEREQGQERGQGDRRRQRPAPDLTEPLVDVERGIEPSPARSSAIPHRAEVDHASNVPVASSGEPDRRSTSVLRRAAGRHRHRAHPRARGVRHGRQRSVGDAPGPEAHRRPRGGGGSAVRRGGGRPRARSEVAHRLRLLHGELATPGRRGPLPHGLQRALAAHPPGRAQRQGRARPVHRSQGLARARSASRSTSTTRRR